jgi:hypothetical protein
VLYLDGGVVFAGSNPVTFAGFTVATYTGNLGGYVGANQKCNQEFPGAFLCTMSDFDLADATVGPGANGAWSDSDRLSSGQRAADACYTSNSGGPWTYDGPATYSSGQSGGYVAPNGSHSSSLCNTSRQLTCCRSAARVVFRGFTTATYTGNLGGYVGANQKCSQEFPGSGLCTLSDFDTSNTSLGPATGSAWVDNDRLASGQRSAASCYTTNSGGAWTYDGPATYSSGQSGSFLTGNGAHSSSLCNLTRQLSCCTRR